MKLSALVKTFHEEQRPVGQMLDDDAVLPLAVAATQFYVGYGHLDCSSVDVAPAPEPVKVLDALASAFADAVSVIDPLHQIGANRLVQQAAANPYPLIDLEHVTADTQVTAGDWALIRPLFLLYVEREQALLLESSRVQGVDVFGRSSGEVQQDISVYEADLAKKAFIQPAFTI